MSRLLAMCGCIALLPGCFLFSGNEAVSPADELLTNVNQIRDFELSLRELFGSYSACGSRDSAITASKQGLRNWTTTPCWVNIGWEPEGKVSGGYWVEVDDETLIVGGLIVNDDGSAFEVRASATQSASILTQ